ncbi:MAG: hypothetical protein QM756_21015 [Polyangiaceae bacterium]
MTIARVLGLGIGFAAVVSITGAGRAEELTGPPLETKGKPTSPPAPVEGITPKLAGLNLLAGVALVDMGPLNDRLSTSGYPTKLPLAFPLLGGQGFGLFSRFTIGGSGSGFLSRSVGAPGNGEVAASGAWGTFDFGYQLVRINGFLLAPVLSLGGYGMSVTIHSKDESSFSQVLGNPGRGTTLTNKGVLGGIGVMTNLIVLGQQSTVRTARSGLSLGVRLGVLYGIPYREWQADGVTADGGPKFGLRGGYAALSLGVGRW